MDKFTLEEIEAAMERFYEKSHGDEIRPPDLMTELTRPKHSFREGEVVYDERYAHYTIIPDPDSQCRPLTLSEMPKAVEDLREAVAGWLQANTSGGWLDLKEALAAFDSEISHE